MPSKPLTVVLIVLVVLAIWGGQYVDRRREVPHWPPGYMEVHGVAAGTGLPAPRPDRPIPPSAVPPADPGDAGQPPREVPSEGGDIHIRDLTLQPISPRPTVAVKDPGTDEFVLLKIYRDGKLRWSGIEVGESFEMLGDLCKKGARRENFLLVIAPDHETPWKFVHWAMDTARENGVYNVGLGVSPIYPSNADRTLLAMLKAPQPKETYVEDPDVPEIKVTLEVERNGGVSYMVYEQAANSLQELMRHLAGFNSEYAEIVDKDYSRDPAKTPWQIRPPAEAPAGAVLRTLDAIRQTAIYTVRFGGNIPPPPR